MLEGNFCVLCKKSCNVIHCFLWHHCAMSASFLKYKYNQDKLLVYGCSIASVCFWLCWTQMDPFIILFCTFIIQLLPSGSHGQSHDSNPTTIHEWLQLDLTRDQVLMYFPSQLRKSIKSLRSTRNHGQLESIPLSSLLSVFKSYVKRTEALAHENKLLAGKARLVQSLAERNAHLEDEVWELRKVSIHVYITVSVTDAIYTCWGIIEVILL